MIKTDKYNCKITIIFLPSFISSFSNVQNSFTDKNTVLCFTVKHFYLISVLFWFITQPLNMTIIQDATKAKPYSPLPYGNHWRHKRSHRDGQQTCKKPSSKGHGICLDPRKEVSRVTCLSYLKPDVCAAFRLHVYCARGWICVLFSFFCN